jgi:purine-binding chemotaxis protein CheW
MAGQLVTFTIAGTHFGIDMLRVQEALHCQGRTTIPLAEPGVAGFINLRGQVVLTVDLGTRLGIDGPPADLEPMMVVVQVDGEPISLLVDDIGEVIDLEGRKLMAAPGTLPDSLRNVIRGVYPLEGYLLLALDIDRAIGATDSLPPETKNPTRRTP